MLLSMLNHVMLFMLLAYWAIIFSHILLWWDISAIDDQLPQCLKGCYKGLLDSYSSYEEKLAKEGNLYRLNYAKEAIKIQLRGYFRKPNG
ncbi:hypothetical protein ACLB2K_042738 [Fragaria x ananassa]